jgi:uncharacterized repeat protein (TIGR01451 family)
VRGSGDKRGRKTFLTAEALQKRRRQQRRTRRTKRGLAMLGIVSLLVLGFASAGALARGSSLLDTITGTTDTTPTDTTVASDSTSTADTSTADTTTAADTSTTDTTATDTTATDTTTTGGKKPKGNAPALVVGGTLPASVKVEQWQLGSWTTGENKGAWSEGDTIPFRIDVDSLAAGDYNIAICRDYKNTTTYGYLKLLPFNTTTTPAGSDHSGNTIDAITGSAGITINSAADTGHQGSCNAGQVEYDANFSTDGGANEFVYWGGHLAKPGETIPPPDSGTVAFQHSAGFYSGASLHMVLLSPDKDLPINPKSIITLGEITVQKVFDSGTPVSFCFNISPDPNGSSPQCTGPSNVGDTAQFLDLPTGTYSVTEVPQAGYLFASGTGTNCTFTGSTGSAAVVSSTNPQFATCVFHNKTQTKPTIATTIKNAADNSTVSGALALGSSVYDTATVTATDGLALTGTLSFRFFGTIDCSDTAVAAGSGIALTGHSSTEGPLAAGSYGFEAQYVAGTNDNYTSSVWGSCEPLTVSPGAVTVSTVIKNAADNSTVSGALALGSSVYDTASLNGLVSGKAATGTLSFRFFGTIDCSDTAVAAGSGIALTGHSSTEGPLAAGSYGFEAQYVAGTNDNYTSSVWGSCEPLTISPGTITVHTVLKNGADDSTIENGSTLPVDSSVYDTASLSGLTQGQDPTGTLSYRFFNTIDCSDEPAASGSGLALTDPSTTQGPLNAGDYGFEAQYVAGTNDNYATSAWSSCEPFTIAKAAPSIHTTPSAGGNVGVVLNDSATLSGGADTPQGTILFKLFGPNNATCNPEGAAPVYTQSVDVDGNGTYNTLPGYSTGAAGTYRWVARYSGDDNNLGVTSGCSDEQVTVTSPPNSPPPPPPAPPVIDLQITKTGSPSPTTTGTNITWTMVVKNNGPDAATGVNVADPLPSGTTFVSVATTQGSCAGGALITCQLGNIGNGASVTITLVTTATTAGTDTNTATVVGNETESNTANNTASASVVVNNPLGVFKPPKPKPAYCAALMVHPNSLFAGRHAVLTLKVTKHSKAVAGVKVRINGAGLLIVTHATNGKGVVKRGVLPKKAGIVTFRPVAQKSCKNIRIGVIGVFTPPVTG